MLCRGSIVWHNPHGYDASPLTTHSGNLKKCWYANNKHGGLYVPPQTCALNAINVCFSGRNVWVEMIENPLFSILLLKINNSRISCWPLTIKYMATTGGDGISLSIKLRKLEDSILRVKCWLRLPKTISVCATFSNRKWHPVLDFTRPLDCRPCHVMFSKDNSVLDDIIAL